MKAGDLLLGLAAAAALVAPGWLAARALRLPQAILAGFILSAVALLLLALGLGAAGLPLRAATLAPPWAAGGLAALAWWWQRRGGETAADAPGKGAAGRDRWPLFLALVPMVAVVAYRAAYQPLFGIDTIFRWDFLARQMLAHGSLAFYPPVSAADYELYGWPDGIAPLVSALYLWLYALAGEARAGLTAPLVLGQYLLLALAVHALARRFSARAAAAAVALLAAAPLVAWATAMGQETGLTALALTSLLLYLPRTRAEESTPAILAAAAAASLGALAREYGLALPLFGLALGAARRLSPGALAKFATIVAVLVLPWYLRNAARTGNPLFDFPCGGLFPANEVHTWLNASYQQAFGWGHLPEGAGAVLLANTAIGIAALLAGAWYFRRTEPALLGGAVLFVVIWAASLGYTAAGFTYSLRVLAPALAIAAVLGGAVLDRWLGDGRHLRGVAIALFLLAGDAATRALTLPLNPQRVPLAEWAQVGRAVHDYHERPIYAEIVRVAGRDKLLVLGPHALLTRLGARTVPLWSPAVRFLFEDHLPAAEVARRLRAEGVGFVLLNTGAVNERFLARSAYFREPGGTLATVWSDGDMVLQRLLPPPAP